MTKHLFIVNPIAGGRDCTEEISRRAAAAFLGRSEDYEVYTTQAPMDAVYKIRTAAKAAEHLRVYACGGDGTFNECINGAALLDNVSVAPMPTGTGNDFCRMFGDEAALFSDLDALLAGTEHPMDLISCNGRYSANICSVGIDARVGTSVHDYDGLPLVGGEAAYVISAVVNLFRGINRKMHIVSDGFEYEGEAAMVCACNGRFYGGGFNPSADARPDDGILDIFIVKKMNLLAAALYIGKYAKARGDELPEKYLSHIRSDHVFIGFEEDNVINIDGEAVFAKDVDMKLIPGAVKLIVPAGMKFFD